MSFNKCSKRPVFSAEKVARTRSIRFSRVNARFDAEFLPVFLRDQSGLFEQPLKGNKKTRNLKVPCPYEEKAVSKRIRQMNTLVPWFSAIDNCSLRSCCKAEQRRSPDFASFYFPAFPEMNSSDNEWDFVRFTVARACRGIAPLSLISAQCFYSIFIRLNFFHLNCVNLLDES